MNTELTMLALYESQDELQTLAGKLYTAGLRMAAEEVEREARLLGERASQLEGVLSDYQQDIATANATSQTKGRWLGVDMAKTGRSQ
ncbi:hypothetical protein [Vreelandella sp. TE19]